MTPYEALQTLQAAGRIRQAWLPGMLIHEEATPGAAVQRCVERWSPPARWRPDVADPATVGCLIALFREASGADDEERDLEAYVEPRGPASARWMMVANCCAWPAAATEGEAVAAAIVVLAQAPA